MSALRWGIVGRRWSLIPSWQIQLHDIFDNQPVATLIAADIGSCARASRSPGITSELSRVARSFASIWSRGWSLATVKGNDTAG